MAVWAAEVAPARAQSNDEETISGQIVARRIDDGRTEFGWRPTGATSRVLPTGRFFPTDVDHRRWLRSTPVVVDGAQIGRIYARLSEDGRIEFAFKPTDGGRISSRVRHFPTDATVGTWLRSTEITFSRFEEDTGITTRPKKKDAIVAALFGYDDTKDSDRHTNHDYNDWGCGVSGQFVADCDVRDSEKEEVATRVKKREWNAYDGGHGGWDVQHNDSNAEFRSLTTGTVLVAGSGKCKAIAVYDDAANRTTIYLHASHVLVARGASVVVGDPLGMEGTSCADGEHLHVEVRVGPIREDVGPLVFARGAGLEVNRPLRCGEISVDPIPYLYWSVSGRPGPQPSGGYDFRPPATDGSCLMNGALASVDSSPDVFVIRRQNGKWFKRKVVAYGLYAVVPEWDEQNVQSVADHVLREIIESPLVRVPGDTDRIYFVEETGEDTIVLRHIPSPAAFERARCDWAGVFTMSEGEYNYWREHVGDALDGGQTTRTFKCPQ